jgi:hypothetical protein
MPSNSSSASASPNTTGAAAGRADGEEYFGPGIDVDAEVGGYRSCWIRLMQSLKAPGFINPWTFQMWKTAFSFQNMFFFKLSLYRYAEVEPDVDAETFESSDAALAAPPMAFGSRVRATAAGATAMGHATVGGLYTFNSMYPYLGSTWFQQSSDAILYTSLTRQAGNISWKCLVSTLWTYRVISSWFPEFAFSNFDLHRYGAEATGAYALAAGIGASAVGAASTALGNRTAATGRASFAAGVGGCTRWIQCDP